MISISCWSKSFSGLCQRLLLQLAHQPEYGEPHHIAEAIFKCLPGHSIWLPRWIRVRRCAAQHQGYADPLRFRLVPLGAQDLNIPGDSNISWAKAWSQNRNQALRYNGAGAPSPVPTLNAGRVRGQMALFRDKRNMPTSGPKRVTAYICFSLSHGATGPETYVIHYTCRCCQALVENCVCTVRVHPSIRPLVSAILACP